MDTKVLSEEQKQQLDLIVHKMTRNKEKSQAIQYVVNDFKDKYGTVPKQPNFGQRFAEGAKNIVKDIVGLEQNKSEAFIPSVFRSTLGSQGLAGVAQLPGRVAYQAMNPDEQVITPGQALGTTGNAALTALTGGTGSIAKNLGLAGVKNFGARVVENAALGVGFQASQNLADKKGVTDNLGTAAIVGGALPVLGTAGSKVKQAIQNRAMPEAERVINSLIKPLEKDFAYGKNPARGILNEGIVANNFNELTEKVSGKISQVGQEIGGVGQQLEQSGVTLNLRPALAPIDEAIQVAAKNNNPTLFNSLQNVKVALTHALTVGEERGVPVIVKGEARNLISAGYNEAKQFLADIAEHTRFTGNPSDDKALNMATKKAYGIAREAMNQGADVVDPILGTQIRNLNERYADLLSARSAINHRDIVLRRQNLVSLAQRFALPVAIATTVIGGAATGNWSAAVKILLAEIAVAGLGSTASKTRIAQFLSRLAPEERAGIFTSAPVLKNLYERLTGQVEPEAGVPKTLQTIEDFLKKPDLSGQATAGTLAAGTLATATLAIPGSKTEYVAPKTEPVKEASKGNEDIKAQIAFRESGVSKEPYSAVNSSNKDGSKDYGKYQVNERTLETYAKKFLGKLVSAEEFLASPELQEQFVDAAIEHLKSLGAKSTDVFLALWHKGWGDVSAKRVAELKNDPQVKKYLDNKPK